MNILVLHPGALGDIILSLPAVDALRGKYPDAVLTFAANLDFSNPTAAGYADRLLSLSTVPLHTLYGPSPDARFWSAYQRIVSWTGAGSIEFETNLRLLCADAVIAQWKPEIGDLTHVSRLFLKSILGWVDTADVRPPLIRPLPREAESARAMLAKRGWDGSPIIAVHPGAGSHSKRWPLSNYRNLGLHLLDDGACLMILEGPAEAGICKELDLPDRRVCCCSHLDLDFQKGMLSQCDAFLGNDSGMAHLAAALGLPCVVLFGPTLPENWAPIGDRVVALRCPSGRLTDIPPDQVYRSLSALL